MGAKLHNFMFRMSSRYTRTTYIISKALTTKQIIKRFIMFPTDQLRGVGFLFLDLFMPVLNHIETYDGFFSEDLSDR